MAWNKLTPIDAEKLKDLASVIRANWAAIELGTDAALLITNDKVSATAGIVDTKLSQIVTASKVHGTALTGLASIVSGAGVIPVANIPDLAGTKITSGTIAVARIDVGTTANKILQLNGDAKIPAVDGSLLTGIKPADLAIASQAQGDILYFDSTNWIRLAAGTSGKFLKTQGAGANPVWDSVASLSNVIFSWNGFDEAIENVSGLCSNVVNLSKQIQSGGVSNEYFSVLGLTNRVILRGKYKHLSGITTVTINSRLWSENAGATEEAILTVDIGGTNNTVKSVTSSTPAWVTSADITVSGLTPGTIYDITISLKNESGSYNAYCSAVSLIAS